MSIDANAVVTFLIFIGLQTGALVFYSGVVAAMLRNHDKRQEKTEAIVEKHSVTIAQLVGREEAQHGKLVCD
jgi:hypothetical protein